MVSTTQSAGFRVWLFPKEKLAATINHKRETVRFRFDFWRVAFWRTGEDARPLHRWVNESPSARQPREAVTVPSSSALRSKPCKMGT
jgi:hypothetical protein